VTCAQYRHPTLPFSATRVPPVRGVCTLWATTLGVGLYVSVIASTPVCIAPLKSTRARCGGRNGTRGSDRCSQTLGAKSGCSGPAHTEDIRPVPERFRWTGVSPSGQSEHAGPLFLRCLAPSVSWAAPQHASRAWSSRAGYRVTTVGPEIVESEAPSREPEHHRPAESVQCVPFPPEGSAGPLSPSRASSSRASTWNLGAARARMELALPTRVAESRL